MPPPPPAEPEPSAVEPAPPPEPSACLRIEWIEVSKRARTLRAACSGGGVLVMTAALSREPRGPKRVRGDDRTPEGLYRIAGAARPSRYHLFIPIDYPSRADADAARAEGILSEADHQRIVAASERGELPPQDTPLGGGIGLHGEGARWRDASRHHDWTTGCIALADADIERIAGLAPVGTPVAIGP